MTQAQRSEEYQTLLNKLPGVVSSKVLLDENGHITDIHILADIGRGAKQIARDVQSALLTKYDIGVDHKIISIAQVDEGGIQVRQSRLAIGRVDLQTEQGKAQAGVVLIKDGETFEGTAIGGNSVQGRLRVVVEATLAAIHKCIGADFTFALSDIVKVNLAGQCAMLLTVLHYAGYGMEYLIGSSIVKDDEYLAAVKATLDAVNRRLNQYF